MAYIFRTIIYLFLSFFVVTSSINVDQEFIGPNTSDLEDISINTSPVSTITAVDINRHELGEISPKYATKDDISSLSYEQNFRKEILEDVENLNIYMKMIAEELANDGVVIVRAVKTSDIDPQNDAVSNTDKEESTTSLSVFSAGIKSSPNVNYLPGMQVAKPPMCKKPDVKFSSTRKAA